MMEGNGASDESAAREAIRARVVAELERKGHARGDMRFRERFVLRTGDEEIAIPIELLVNAAGRPGLLVKCVSGHTSTREQAAVALARLLPEGPVPFAVVANETDAVVIDTASRRTVGSGLAGLPAPGVLRSRILEAGRAPREAGGREREQRILATYVHLRCPVPKGPY